MSPLSSYLRSLINKYSTAEKMYLLLDEEIKKLIFKESQIVPCHKLTPRQERICNERCLLQFIMNRREVKVSELE